MSLEHPKVYHAEIVKVSFLWKSQGYKFAAAHDLGIVGYEEKGLIYEFTFSQDK